MVSIVNKASSSSISSDNSITRNNVNTSQGTSRLNSLSVQPDTAKHLRNQRIANTLSLLNCIFHRKPAIKEPIPFRLARGSNASALLCRDKNSPVSPKLPSQYGDLTDIMAGLESRRFVSYDPKALKKIKAEDKTPFQKQKLFEWTLFAEARNQEGQYRSIAFNLTPSNKGLEVKVTHEDQYGCPNTFVLDKKERQLIFDLLKNETKFLPENSYLIDEELPEQTFDLDGANEPWAKPYDYLGGTGVPRFRDPASYFKDDRFSSLTFL